MNSLIKRNLVAMTILAGVTGMFIAGCAKQPSADIQPAQPSAESFVTAGDYEMHFNAIRSDQLTPDVARAYGIERSKNKVLLNVSVLNHINGPAAATEANVSVLVHNLNDQVKNLALRRITEGTAIYYVGEVDISGAETLVFEITATPNGSGNTITAKLTREFFAN